METSKRNTHLHIYETKNNNLQEYCSDINPSYVTINRNKPQKSVKDVPPL